MTASTFEARVSTQRRVTRAIGAFAFAVLTVVASACVTPPPPPPGDGVLTSTVGAGNGFGGGTIYYQSNLSGRVGAIAVVPGFNATQSSIAWYGPLLAQQGFIVFTIDTNSGFDLPPSRATQLLAALDFLANNSTVASNVDSGREAIMGWSMGGGGTLEASLQRPALKAAIPLAPWDTTTNFSSDKVPTLIVGCQSDTVAPPSSHAIPFYNSIPTTTPKAYLEVAGGAHDCVTTQNSTISQFVVPWMKRFVNGDTTASAALCPPPAVGNAISAYQADCPY